MLRQEPKYPPAPSSAASSSSPPPAAADAAAADAADAVADAPPPLPPKPFITSALKAIRSTIATNSKPNYPDASGLHRDGDDYKIKRKMPM